MFDGVCVCAVVTKFGLLCELYTNNKKEMNKSEKQEVLEYLRARWVMGKWSWSASGESIARSP